MSDCHECDNTGRRLRKAAPEEGCEYVESMCDCEHANRRIMEAHDRIVRRRITRCYRDSDKIEQIEDIVRQLLKRLDELVTIELANESRLRRMDSRVEALEKRRIRT